MTTLLFFVVFPITPAVLASRWFLADWRYRRYMTAVGVDLSADRLIRNGPSLTEPIRVTLERFEADRKARNGDYGPEATALWATQHRRWRAYWVSLIVCGLVGFVLTGFIK